MYASPDDARNGNSSCTDRPMPWFPPVTTADLAMCNSSCNPRASIDWKSIAKPLIGLSMTWSGVPGARLLDRFGTGFHKSPRRTGSCERPQSGVLPKIHPRPVVRVTITL